MRISDWISDVCSSDLTLQAVGNPRNLPQFVETNLDLLRVQGQPAPAGIGNNGGIPDDFHRMKTSTKYLYLEYAPGSVTVTSTTARPEVRCVGKDCVRPCRSRCLMFH